MAGDPPWRQHSRLARLADQWRTLAGLRVTELRAGPGWVDLELGSRERTHLFLFTRSGAVLAFDSPGPLPRALHAALGGTVGSTLGPHLKRYRLTGVGVLPEDRVLALDFAGDGEADSRLLLHQLFGPRGNLTLLDKDNRLLWSLHRPPHSLLCQRPDPAVFSPPDLPVSEPEETTGSPAMDPRETDPDPRARFRKAALDHLYSKMATDWAARLGSALHRSSGAGRRLQQNLTRDLARADRGDEQRRLAETLAAHLAEVSPGTDRIQLESPHDGQPVTIDLDPGLSPVANMERYFRLARKADRGRAVITENLARANQKLEQLLRLQVELEAVLGDPVDRLARLLDWAGRNAKTLGLKDHPLAPTKTRPGTGAEARPFRRYRIDGSWEVWVGRNSRENDRLTHQAAHSNDLWFHAQSVSGSHVILRTGGKAESVPKKVLVKAASLAALHSRARHASLVPVIYTLRKHVTKPRKTPPGTAACRREKSLMVKPCLPEGVQKC